MHPRTNVTGLKITRHVKYKNTIQKEKNYSIETDQEMTDDKISRQGL